MLNCFEKWMLRIIATKAVKQGNQYHGVAEYYSYILKAADKTFTEENDISTLTFMEDRHKVASNKIFKYAQRETEEQASLDVKENKVTFDITAPVYEHDRLVVKINDNTFSVIVYDVKNNEIKVMHEFGQDNTTLIIKKSQILENKGTFLV